MAWSGMAIVRYYARPVAIPLWEVVKEKDGVNTALRLDPMPEAEARAKAMELTRENDRLLRAARANAS